MQIKTPTKGQAQGQRDLRGGGGGKRGPRIRCGKRWERSTEGQEIEQRCTAVEDGELEVATRKSQKP